MIEPLLSVRNLSTSFRTETGVVRAVDGVSFDLPPGGSLALVGGSGSGKTTLLLSLMRLVPAPAGRIESGQVLLGDRDLLGLSESEMTRVRGCRISLVFQGMQAFLSPASTVGSALGDIVRLRDESSRAQARLRSVELLKLMAIGSPQACLGLRPHQLSVGMRQRVGMAMALACRPELLLCDEPAEALDAITRAQIFDVVRRLQDDAGLGVIVATHDLGVAAELAREIVVLEAGRVTDAGRADEILARTPPLTQDLQSAFAPLPQDTSVKSDPPPRLSDPAPPVSTTVSGSKPKALLRVDNLAKFFPLRHGVFSRIRFVRAVDGVSLYIRRGETLGLVGESGSGKTTLGRAILRLSEPTFGRVVVDGKDVVRMRPGELRAARRTMQIIHQDAFSSLDTEMTAFDIVAEGIRIHHLAESREQQRSKVLALFERVGLPADVEHRRPEAMSVGERRRVTIARALAVEPSFVVCDDPTSELDTPARAQIISLLKEVQSEKKTTFLLITRDLAVAKCMSHRIAVMYLGKIVEMAKVTDLFDAHCHPYTRALLSALPAPEKRLRVVLEGDPPSALEPPQGCAFHPRCPRAQKGRCDTAAPQLEPVASGSGHRVACFFPLARAGLLPDFGDLA